MSHNLFLIAGEFKLPVVSGKSFIFPSNNSNPDDKKTTVVPGNFTGGFGGISAAASNHQVHTILEAFN